MGAFRQFKIRNRQHIAIIAFFFFLTTAPGVHAQLKKSAYGVDLIGSTKTYRQTLKTDSNKKMIELHALAPGIIYDLKYAGADNFVKNAIYPANTPYTFLRLPAAKALAGVQNELFAKGLTLKIFDAYRPYAVTVTFWEMVKDERYVANPSTGSGHNRGLAVDLTIADIKTGAELDMGTGFDNFTDTAHHSFTALPEQVLQNRNLLKDVMQRHGFKLFETEWWHYSWPNERNYEVLDIPLKKLYKETFKH
jgi:D-alanyl-D-alanine dipeptidase